MVTVVKTPATILAVFIAGIFVRSPQMIIKPGLLAACLRNFSLSSSVSTPVFLHIIRSISQRETNQLSYFSSLSSVKESANKAIMSSIPVSADAANVKLLNQNEAIQVDQDLFNEYKFSVDQLMELAGLSVACAVAQVYGSKKSEKVLIITGPGNNGGDGMVVARHLKLFGFDNVTILNARKPSKDLFINLLHQVSMNDVEISYDAEVARKDSSVGLIVDALFGFSFKPPVRPDFLPFMNILKAASEKSVPVVAVDIPSGWDVEKGPPSDESIRFMPDMLVSLTAPKMCASHFQGPYHFIGGRFVPKRLAAKYSLNLPSYAGTDCIVRIK